MIRSLPKIVLLCLTGAALIAGAGCGYYPKYAPYSSPKGDFKCAVPRGWNVMTEYEGADYSHTTFFGAFEPRFYLGVPSFQVRWFANYRAHLMPDGILEAYSSPDDYIERILSDVYGPKRVMQQDVHDISVAGRKNAKHFVVVSPVPVPKDRKWGVREDVARKGLVNIRQHAYVVVPADKGFYVLIYPATRDGYAKYEKEFNKLVNSFELIVPRAH